MASRHVASQLAAHGAGGSPSYLVDYPQRWAVGQAQTQDLTVCVTQVPEPLRACRVALGACRLRENYVGTHIEDPHIWCNMSTVPQAAQKGCPARPQRVNTRGVPLGYVEGLSDARTLLADFFSSLLELKNQYFVRLIQPGDGRGHSGSVRQWS